VPLFDARPLASYVDGQVAATRFTLALAAAFATVALLMAMLALYGVISYAVSQRTPELGLRIALGAGEGSIARLVLGHGGLMAGMGLAIGLGLALAATRTIRRLLVDVPADDPVTFAVTSGVLAGAALIASYVPARRAARLDPAATLRSE
jgi:ABC-type antimicrobial peptide transport system permease subunit